MQERLKFATLSAICAVLAAYYGVKFVTRRNRLRFHWKNIKKLQNSFKKCRAILETECLPEFHKWKKIVSLSFEELRQQLQIEELKAVDVLRAFQFRAIECSQSTNCVTEFIEFSSDLAIALDGKAFKGPLHGIPVSVKECFIVKGTESTGGHASYIGEFTDSNDAPIVEFLKWAGAVPFCKTNLPQGMLTIDSRNAVYGTTTNPWDSKRGPGGSSSGEGALISGGGSVLGLGSDVGGSIRIPAAWCGCLALKPTSQRFLAGGSCPSERYPRVMVSEFATNGFMSRDVETLVQVHKVLYSKETFQRFQFGTMVPVPFDEACLSSKKPLRIAFYYFDGIFEATPSMKRGVDMAKAALENLGHELVHWQPFGAKEAYLLICEALAIDGSKQLLKVLNDDVEIAYANEPNMATMKWPYWRKRYVAWRYLTGFRADVMLSLRPGGHPDDMNDMYRRVRDFRRIFSKMFSDGGFDAILCPAFGCPALPIELTRDALGAASYTCLFNLLNWPAGVLPVSKVTSQDEASMKDYPGHLDPYHGAVKKGHVSDSVGLPIAVQLAAPQYREEQVLRLMSEVESSVQFKMLS